MKLALALIAVVLVTIVLTVLNLRAFVAVQREELIARTALFLGRPLHVEAVGPSWWPLGIRMQGLRVDDAPEFGTRPLIEVPSAVVPIRLASLVGARVEPAGVRLAAPRIHLARDERGRWNVATLGRVREPDRNGKGGERGRRDAFHIPVEWVAGVALAGVDEGTVDIEDRAVTPPRRLVLEDLQLRARDLRYGATARVDLDAVARADGDVARLHAAVEVPRLGEHDAEHTPFIAEIVLRDLELGPAATLAGFATGFTGRVDEVRADVQGTSLQFGAALSGRAAADSARSGSRPALPAAELVLDGRIEGTRDRVDFRDARLSVGTLTLVLEGAMTRTPPGGVVAVRSLEGSSFALGSVDPPLVGRDVRFDLLFSDAGTKLAGAMRLDDVRLDVNGAVATWIPPTGEVRFTAAPFGGSLHGEIGLANGQALRIRADASSLDLGAGVGRFVPSARSRFRGRVSGSGTMSATLGARGIERASMSGGGELTVVDGHIDDMNIPERVLGDVAGVSSLARWLSFDVDARDQRLVGGDDTVVQRAVVPFTIGGERFSTQRATLNAEDFDMTGAGWIGLDRQVRFHGDLVLSPAVSRRLLDRMRALRILSNDDGRIAVPFRVRGRLGHAHPEADPKRLRARGLSGLLAGKTAPRADDAAPSRGEGRDRDAAEDLIERLEELVSP